MHLFSAIWYLYSCIVLNMHLFFYKLSCFVSLEILRRLRLIWSCIFHCSDANFHYCNNYYNITRMIVGTYSTHMHFQSHIMYSQFMMGMCTAYIKDGDGQLIHFCDDCVLLITMKRYVYYICYAHEWIHSFSTIGNSIYSY